MTVGAHSEQCYTVCYQGGIARKALNSAMVYRLVVMTAIDTVGRRSCTSV